MSLSVTVAWLMGVFCPQVGDLMARGRQRQHHIQKDFEVLTNVQLRCEGFQNAVIRLLPLHQNPPSRIFGKWVLP
jgi:hypothetical protein